MPTDRSGITGRRQAFEQARQTRLKAQADLVSKSAALAGLLRTLASNAAGVQAAQTAVNQQRQVVIDAFAAEKQAIDAVTTDLNAWNSVSPGRDQRAEASYPIVLLPVRMETRFVAARASSGILPPTPPQLLVRIYPDEISADPHEPELSADEFAAGQAYWTAAQAGGEQLTAWQTLLQIYPTQRAAWIVAATTPTNPGDLTTIPTPSFFKPDGWSRAVEARLQPDRYVVIATRGTTSLQGVGSSVIEPLALSVGPDSQTPDQAISPDGTLKLDDNVKWTVDFDLALANGMAIQLPIGDDDFQLGFDRVIVVGVKTSMDAVETSTRLGALFDAHHYTRGLAFVKQGTPTSNAAGTPAAFPPADPDGQRSFNVERVADLQGLTPGAGTLMQIVLGLPSGKFIHVEGADLSEVTPAQQMNRALFSSTLGYYLDQIMSPLVGTAAVNEVGQIFSDWVLPRGLVSAFRVGNVPYGVLATTSLALWQDDASATPVQKRLSQLLQKLRPIWLQSVANAPHVGRSSDPDQDLLDVLSMDASAREVRVRRVLGNGSYLNLLSLFGFSDATWDQVHQTMGAAALAAAGLDPASHPRALDLNFYANNHLYNGALVDTAPTSETDALGVRDYISWIRTATIDQLHLEALPATIPAGIKEVLLYRFLRHGALAEYHWWGNILSATYSTTPLPVWKEPELVSIIPGTESALTPWLRLKTPVTLPVLGSIDLAAFFDGDNETQLRALTGVGDFRDALGVLAPLPTAELERLFGEALDCVSHRLDAWITSLASRRLGDLRADNDGANQVGCFVGAYGWVENLKPETATTVTLPDGTLARTSSGGYVQGPSMAHAMTGAVLRNAYLTHVGQTDSPYAIDLSSSQTRMGRFLLDSVRNGQPLGAVLGYLIERALHEAQVESLIDPIRQVAPLVANKLSDDMSDPVETIAARNVVDGLALRNKWKAGTLFGAGALSPTITGRAVLEARLGQIDRDVDAVADLLLAESVHQIVIGSTAASGAGLDALAQGVRPPDPDVVRGVTGGTTLTHRLSVVMGPTPPAPAPGWPATPTPRAACEPYIDAWVGGLLGDPRQVRCRVQYPDVSTPPITQTVEVTLDQLQLRPLDVLALAKVVASDPAASEIDRRVLYAAFGDVTPANAAVGASFTIVYAADPSWPRATTRTVPELIDLANAVSRVLGGMRPLTAVDVIVPDNTTGSSDVQAATAEATTRAQAALATMTALQSALTGELASVVPGTQPTAAQVAALRAQLRAAAQLGLTAAFPPFVAGGQEGGISPLSLLDQAAAVLAELGSRLTQAVNKAPAGMAQAIFGRDFQLLVGFSYPSTSATGGELGQALAYGPTMLGGDVHAVDRWLTGATRVRDGLGRWRLLRILAEASGAPPAAWSVAQLPHDPTASWVALPPNTDEVRASGKLSLVLHAPYGTVDLTQPTYGLFLDEWVETIPNASEHTGVAFRYEDTGGEAPQTILVAIPPAPTTTSPAWDFNALVTIINETLDNAKLRALDLSSLDSLAQLIPGIFLAANAGDGTIATLLPLKLDVQIAKEGL